MTKTNGYFAAVFDGHGGWQVSNRAALRLHTILENELTASKDPLKAIDLAYERFEDELKKDVIASFDLGYPKSAYVGACALTALI